MAEQQATEARERTEDAERHAESAVQRASEARRHAATWEGRAAAAEAAQQAAEEEAQQAAEAAKQAAERLTYRLEVAAKGMHEARSERDALRTAAAGVRHLPAVDRLAEGEGATLSQAAAATATALHTARQNASASPVRLRPRPEDPPGGSGGRLGALRKTPTALAPAGTPAPAGTAPAGTPLAANNATAPDGTPLMGEGGQQLSSGSGGMAMLVVPPVVPAGTAPAGTAPAAPAGAAPTTEQGAMPLVAQGAALMVGQLMVFKKPFKHLQVSSIHIQSVTSRGGKSKPGDAQADTLGDVVMVDSTSMHVVLYSLRSGSFCNAQVRGNVVYRISLSHVLKPVPVPLGVLFNTSAIDFASASQILFTQMARWRNLIPLSVSLAAYDAQQLSSIGLTLEHIEELPANANLAQRQQWLSQGDRLELLWIAIDVMRGTTWCHKALRMPDDLRSYQCCSSFGEDVSEEVAEKMLSILPGFKSVSKDIARAAGDRMVTIDADDMPPSVHTFLAPIIDSSGSVLAAEMKSTKLSETTGSQTGISYVLSGAWKYKPKQWEDRANKLHLLLVMSQTPPRIALLAATSEAMAHKSGRCFDEAMAVDLEARTESYPTLTQAHFERWLHSICRKYQYSVLCIAPIVAS